MQRENKKKNKKKQIKKIGVISVRHETNVGNNLIKYAMSIILKEFGYSPYIIGTHWNNMSISFINKTTISLKEFNSFFLQQNLFIIKRIKI